MWIDGYTRTYVRDFAMKLGSSFSDGTSCYFTIVELINGFPERDDIIGELGWRLLRVNRGLAETTPKTYLQSPDRRPNSGYNEGRGRM
jgi:hypothetical protein